MPTSRKRDNAYFAARLKKDGHHELLNRVESGEIKMYAATQEAGYRSKQPRSPADKLLYHWKRATYEERMLFIGANYRVIGELMKDVYARQKKIKAAKKTSQ